MNDLIYQQKYTEVSNVQYSDVGWNGNIKPYSVLNLCQNIASRHAYNLGISAVHMGKVNKTWVVRSYDIYFHSLPKWNEEIKLTTLRAPVKRLYDIRRFEFYNKDGKLLIEANCVWILVDKTTGKPCRLDRNIPKDLMEENEQLNAVCFEEIKDFDLPHKTVNMKVLKEDIDFNNHANNASYIKWALDSEESLDFDSRIKTLKIRYFHELLYNENFIIQSKKDSQNVCIKKFLSENNDLLTLIKLETF